MSLASFEPNIRGTRNLVDLARASAYGSAVKFLFTSSVAQAISWDRSRGAYPEEVLLDPQFAVGSGYGEAKYVTERVSHRLKFDLSYFTGLTCSPHTDSLSKWNSRHLL